VVLDRGYAQKADIRKGGVGTETQIISAEVYNKSDQNKFVAIIAEKDAEGKPYLPVYYKSRIYIDLSEPDGYAANFDQLLRWIFDKPLHVKPELGRTPEFLKENQIALGTQSRARRAVEAIRNAAPSAVGALNEYLSTLSTDLEKFRIEPTNAPDFDELVVKNIDAFTPYRDEYIQVISVLARYWPFPSAQGHIHRFFENMIPYLFRKPGQSSWRDTDFDSFAFIVHELFLYTIALLLIQERFDVVNELLTSGYYLGPAAENKSEPMRDFEVFRQHCKSFQIRNQRLNLRRLSVRSDLLKQRSEASGVQFSALMQADFVLFLRSCTLVLEAPAKDWWPRQWWPETLLFAQWPVGAFELFARAQSRAYFERVKGMLGVKSLDEFKELFVQFSQSAQRRLHVPTWDHVYIVPAELAGIDKLGSRP
jgi:hypothetical protein